MSCMTCGGSGWANAYKAAAPLQEFSFKCSFCQSSDLRGIKSSIDAPTVWWDSEREHQGFILRPLTIEADRAHSAAVDAWRSGGMK